MRVVITETQGSSPVGTWVWALHLAIEVTLDAGLKLCIWVPRWCWNASFKLCVELLVWDAGLKLYVWVPQWCWKASFKLCVDLCVWDARFKLYVWVLKWYWDVGFELCVLALQWCWDAGFEPCILPLHEWLWLASRLKHGLYYLMTYLQWFLDSLENPLQSFWNSMVK